jgi:hypothetical protein
MGFLGKLFGGGKEYPPLDPASPEGKRMEPYREVATAFANKLHDKLEVVPTDKVLYAFIGHPPEQFGVAWFENGEEHNFKTLMKARNLQTRDINRISEELRAAYRKAMDEPRFQMDAGKKKVIVHPSPTLAADLMKIIHEVEP